MRQGLGDVGPMFIGGVDTNEVIGKDGFSELNRVADDILDRLFKCLDVHNFMKCSVEFSEKAGFVSERLLDVIRRLNRIESCFAS